MKAYSPALVVDHVGRAAGAGGVRHEPDGCSPGSLWPMAITPVVCAPSGTPSSANSSAALRLTPKYSAPRPRSSSSSSRFWQAIDTSVIQNGTGQFSALSRPKAILSGSL